MSRWLDLIESPEQSAIPLPDTLTIPDKSPASYLKAVPDTLTEPDRSPFCQVLSVCQVVKPGHTEHAAGESASLPAAGPPPAEPFPYGAAPGDRPRTWTGKVVSLDAWRQLSDWERHGPGDRLFCGACQQWVARGAGHSEAECWHGGEA